MIDTIDTLPDDPGPPIMERRLLPDVPEGYVLVPIEPTEAMRAACKGYHPMAGAVWSAMIAAAQSDPSTGEQGNV